MPKIPKYQPGQVQNRGVPDLGIRPSATAGAFGANKAQLAGQFGEGLGRIGEVLVKHSVDEQRILDNALARDALVKGQGQFDLDMHGDGTRGKQGYYGRQGADAATVVEDAQKRLDEIKREAKKSLKSQYAQDRFDASWDSYSASSLHALARHRSAQIQKYDNDTKLAENNQLMNHIVLNHNNSEMVESDLARIEQNTMSIFKGMGPEVQKDEVFKARSLAHEKAITAIAQDSPEAAQGYIDKYKDELDPLLKEKMEAVLEKKIDKEKVSDMALKIASEGGSIEQQLAKADKAPAKIREEVRSVVTERYNVAQKVKKLKYDRAIQNEAVKVLSDPVKYKAPVGEIDIDDINKLEALQRRKIDETLEQNGVGNTRIQKNNRYYYEFMVKRNSEILNMSFDDVWAYSDKVHTDDFKKIFETWNEVRKDPDSISRFRTEHQFMDDQVKYFKDLRYDADDTPEEASEKAGRVNRLMAEFTKVLYQYPEEQRTEKLMGEIAKRLLTPIHDPRGIFGKKRIYFAYELPYLESEVQRRTMLKEKMYPETILPYLKKKGTQIEYKKNPDLQKDLWHVTTKEGYLYLFDDDGESIEVP